MKWPLKEKGRRMKIKKAVSLAAVLSCLAGAVTPLLFGAAASRPAPNDPAALAPLTHFRGGPASAADIAEIVGLNSLPLYTPKSEEGDFLIKPPYANAAEQTVGADVPKGRVEHFTLKAADSKFYPDSGLRGTTATRARR